MGEKGDVFDGVEGKGGITKKDEVNVAVVVMGEKGGESAV